MWSLVAPLLLVLGRPLPNQSPIALACLEHALDGREVCLCHKAVESRSSNLPHLVGETEQKLAEGHELLEVEVLVVLVCRVARCVESLPPSSLGDLHAIFR